MTTDLLVFPLGSPPPRRAGRGVPLLDVWAMKKRRCDICDSPIGQGRRLICRDCERTIIDAVAQDRNIKDDVEQLLEYRHRIADWIRSNRA